MALDWLTESLPAIIYGFAATNIHFLFGALASKMTNILNPVYKVYENEIYPDEKSGEFFGSISAISTYINKIQGCAKEV